MTQHQPDPDVSRETCEPFWEPLIWEAFPHYSSEDYVSAQIARTPFQTAYCVEMYSNGQCNLSYLEGNFCLKLFGGMCELKTVDECKRVAEEDYRRRLRQAIA